MEDQIQLMYNIETDHLHNSKLSDNEDNGYFKIDIIERNKAFQFGVYANNKLKHCKTKEEVINLYKRFMLKKYFIIK